MPERIQLRRTKGWRKPEGAIVVDRRTKFGNPWLVFWDKRYRQWMVTDRHGSFWTSTDGTRGGAHQRAVGFYRDWVEWGTIPGNVGPLERRDLTLRRKAIREHLADLRGHDLGCTCYPEFACHADVLLELANPQEAPSGA
jgi:hypothetical protein